MTDGDKTVAELEDEMTKQEAKADLVVVFVLAVPSLLWFGFAISCMWGWFVAPLGIAPLGTLHAAGLGLLCRRFGGFTKPEPGERGAANVIAGMITTAFMLVFGLVLHWCM